MIGDVPPQLYVFDNILRGRVVVKEVEVPVERIVENVITQEVMHVFESAKNPAPAHTTLGRCPA